METLFASMALPLPLPLFIRNCKPRRKTPLTLCFHRPIPQIGKASVSSSDINFTRRGILESLTYFTLLSLGEGISQKTAEATEQGLGENELKSIQTELRKTLKRPRAAGLLRLVFHDAGTFNIKTNTGGMNGSIIYELDRPENSGLDRSIKILAAVKDSIGSSLSVSWADLIAVAGAEAVALCRGPIIPIKLGRLDAVIPDPEGQLPEESLDASNLKKNFLAKGFTTSELVALSGAHTLGSKGFGNPLVFDNSYYKILLEKPWTQIDNEMGSMIGLPSDRTLVDDDECFRLVTYYAEDESKFFEDFSAAYIKLVNSGAKWRAGAT